MIAPVGPKQVIVAGAFDDLRSRQIRFLEEAAKLGEVTALLRADELVRQCEGRGPKFPEAERAYILRAIRFVRRVVVARNAECRMQNAEFGTSLVAASERAGLAPDVVVLNEKQDSQANRAACQARGVECHVLGDEKLRGFPEAPPAAVTAGRKRVMVTGCYDWVHSGHVRFFEEVSAYGDLYVVLGHDANIRLLKGAGHPLFPQEERRYVVGAIRYVTQALIATGDGWLDAEPEMRRLKPDIYAVNEDGDRGGKREYCAKQGIEYLVLKRIPAPGLPARTSTDLRGF
jgi:cytidyltransferase-like protein